MIPGSSRSVAIVAIGRNEGERLKACLRAAALSSARGARTVVYVDSGSADGSAEYARSVGCRVVELDASRPFTAARARNEGFACAMEHAPDAEFVQFVDGDCELEEGWLEAGDAALARETMRGWCAAMCARFIPRRASLTGCATWSGGRRRERFRPQAADSWRGPAPSRRWAAFGPM